MKKFLSFLIACIMVFSAVGIVAAEDGEPDPEPEFVRPVDITAVDENGDALDGVELKLTDADGNVVKNWVADGEQTLLLPEGEYLLKTVSAPDGYLAGDEVPVTVARLQAEEGTFTGNCTLLHTHPEICSNTKHAGIELFTITDGNGNTIPAYCFNHGFKNPFGAPYKAYPATKADLFYYAVNKSDSISKDELYSHVMYIMLNGDAVVANALANENIEASELPVLQNYLKYMAIKNFTDPKKFPQTVLKAMIDHAKRENHEFPQAYINAYNALIGPDTLPTYPDGLLYFYYPAQYDITDENSYQILISAKRVPTQEVKVVIHPSETFTATLKWNDRSNRDKLRPTPEKLLPKLHLYLGGEEITVQYPNCMTVTDNGDNTYTVKIVNLSDEDLTLKIDSIFGYKASKSSMQDGGTITLTHSVLEKLDPINPMPPVKPITPPWGGSK